MNIAVLHSSAFSLVRCVVRKSTCAQSPETYEKYEKWVAKPFILGGFWHWAYHFTFTNHPHWLMKSDEIPVIRKPSPFSPYFSHSAHWFLVKVPENRATYWCQSLSPRSPRGSRWSAVGADTSWNCSAPPCNSPPWWCWNAPVEP